MSDEVPITELEKIEADRVDGVGTPANGIPFLMMKSTGKVGKDWAAWDAAHEAGGSGSNAGAASAQSQARQTQAEQKNGKKPDAAQLHNAHEVHEAHEEHLHAEHETHVGHTEHETAEEHAAAVRAERGQTHPASSSTPKLTAQERTTAAAQQEIKAEQAMRNQKSSGGRDCPGCTKTFDADHKGNTCPNCGADLPAADDAAKSLPDWHADAVEVVKKAMVRGKVDETADIDGGQQAIALVGKLIGYEAQELAAGNLGEVADIELLGAAAGLLRQWVTGESAVQDGNVMPATVLAQSAAKADLSTASINDLPDSAFAHIESGGSKDADGKTTPRSLRHFPVHDAAHAKNALARLSSSPFGDAAKPKVMAAAKKFGIDTAKSVASEVAEDATAVNTEPQGYESLTKSDLEAAVTKAMAPLQERIASLDAELAKVKATPIPGGPMMNVSRQPSKAADGEDWAAKAAYYRAQADAVSDPGTADGYRQLARQAEDKAKP